MAPYWYGDPFLEAAICSAFVPGVAACASVARVGISIDAVTVAAVRTDAVPARERSAGMPGNADMPKPFVIRLRKVTCRVRADKVARPHTWLHPKNH
ncbi:hypothetical protein GCM10010219_11620 [Streptomyces netropsis]|nr:hypothetical protein GCM10010219_11620 [Streptomyces netropsis]